jgi:hypothetical protein
MYTLDNRGQTGYDLDCMQGEMLFFLLDYDVRRISVDRFRNGVVAGHWRTALIIVAFGFPIDRSISWESFHECALILNAPPLDLGLLATYSPGDLGPLQVPG